jgi:hydrogenase/urease accessory protein HupE
MKRLAKRALLPAAAATAVLSPVAAQAHLVVSGMGPLYDGVVHFGLSPEDFLPVIALAFFCGLRGAATARLTFAVLPAAWFIGGMMAMLGLVPPHLFITVGTAVMLMIVGGLLASDAKLPASLCALAAAALGIVRGMADLSDTDPSAGHVLTLLGMCATLAAVYAIAASLTLPLKRVWMIMTTRVAGSWMAALGLLLIGWILRYGDVIR